MNARPRRPTTIRLGKDILGSGVRPADADRDAAHIALATVHEMDMLLTWYCRHIANAFIQRRWEGASIDQLHDGAAGLPQMTPGHAQQ
jgi:hypothetical protein